jgi:hypothetical protein
MFQQKRQYVFAVCLIICVGVLMCMAHCVFRHPPSDHWPDKSRLVLYDNHATIFFDAIGTEYSIPTSSDISQGWQVCDYVWVADIVLGVIRNDTSGRKRWFVASSITAKAKFDDEVTVSDMLKIVLATDRGKRIVLGLQSRHSELPPVVSR